MRRWDTLRWVTARARHLGLLLLLSSAAPAAAQPGEVRGVLHERLVLLLNPMGAEHQLRAGVRGRLGDPNELLFMGAHAEAGAVGYVSPVYAIHGGYLQVSPLAFLVLRAEMTGTVMWPIGMDGAGYYPVDGYGGDVRAEQLPGHAGETASGWNLTVAATLQGLVPLGPLRLLIWDEVQLGHVSLGAASHFYSLKHDLVLAGRDWVLENDALLLAEVSLSSDASLRFGAYDNLRYVPSSGYLGHQVGPVLMLSFERPSDEVTRVELFVRGGWYTDHVVREAELTTLGVVSVTYDLGRLR